MITLQTIILTLNMLNCLKDHKRCIHISFHILILLRRKKTKFTFQQPYMLPIVYCQYHFCRYPGDLRSQGISRHDIDQASWNISFLALEQLRHWFVRKFAYCWRIVFGIFIQISHLPRRCYLKKLQGDPATLPQWVFCLCLRWRTSQPNACTAFVPLHH